MSNPTWWEEYRALINPVYNLKHREKIRRALSPGEAKRLGKLVSVRTGWEHDKLKVMKSLVGQKFRKNKDLAQLLLETGDEELVEVNGWGDRFWGVCNGEGKNHLGEILMSVRGELSKEGINTIDPLLKKERGGMR